MTTTQLLPVIVVVILLVARRVHPVLARLVTWTTMALMGTWAVLSVLEGGLQLPPFFSDATLVVGYIALALLVVNTLTVLVHVGNRLTVKDGAKPTIYGRMVQIASVGGIAAVIYIASNHRL